MWCWYCLRVTASLLFERRVSLHLKIMHFVIYLQEFSCHHYLPSSTLLSITTRYSNHFVCHSPLVWTNSIWVVKIISIQPTRSYRCIVNYSWGRLASLPVFQKLEVQKRTMSYYLLLTCWHIYGNWSLSIRALHQRWWQCVMMQLSGERRNTASYFAWMKIDSSWWLYKSNETRPFTTADIARKNNMKCV